ncbi:Nudix hydrolase [Lachnellula suecica]|uniref:Nudix hydrolase n=1 Tax=Lachnellula suecica TaxID=602035 RepID=A0A8T9C1V4_9HELO|nr:Nudix hydrolase [Lachnellula suecica]
MASAPGPHVRVGVGAFILKSAQEPASNPQFLIGKRINSHGGGTFALPGGHLEFGESPEECAVREIMEETGLKVTNVRFLTATNDYMPADSRHYITLWVACVRETDEHEPQVVEPDKCEGWEWQGWEDFKGWVEGYGEASEKKLFSPMLNLIAQRPGVIPALT